MRWSDLDDLAEPDAGLETARERLKSLRPSWAQMGGSAARQRKALVVDLLLRRMSLRAVSAGSRCPRGVVRAGPRSLRE